MSLKILKDFRSQIQHQYFLIHVMSSWSNASADGEQCTVLHVPGLVKRQITMCSISQIFYVKKYSLNANLT